MNESPSDHSASLSGTQIDPVYHHARREAAVILIAWAVFLIWTIGVSYMMSYDQAGKGTNEITFGFPNWVFWGVILPWCAATIFSVVYALKGIKDDALVDETGENPGSSEKPDATNGNETQ